MSFSNSHSHNEMFKVKYHKSHLTITDNARDTLMSHNWPGNVREIQHTIERGVIMTDDNLITPSDFNLLLEDIDHYDLVTGVRSNRQDSFVKNISSTIANGIRRSFTNDGMDDTGCTANFKFINTCCITRGGTLYTSQTI